MIGVLLEELEASRARTVAKLEALEKDRERLLGRLEGLDLAIGVARPRLVEEMENKRRALEEAQAPIVLEGVDFGALEEECVARFGLSGAPQTAGSFRRLDIRPTAQASSQGPSRASQGPFCRRARVPGLDASELLTSTFLSTELHLGSWDIVQFQICGMREFRARGSGREAMLISQR